MTNEEKLDKIMQYLEKLNKRVSCIEESLSAKKVANQVVETPLNLQIEESFVEFFKKFHPQKETDKTLVIMSFLESKRGIKDITTKDISEGFREVREKIPTNVADKIQMLHKKGFIMPGNNMDKLKGWLITRTGLEYLGELKNEN